MASNPYQIFIGAAVVTRDVAKGEIFGYGKGWSSPNSDAVAVKAGQRIRVLECTPLHGADSLSHLVRFEGDTPPFLVGDRLGGKGSWWLPGDAVGYVKDGRLHHFAVLLQEFNEEKGNATSSTP